MSEGGISDYTKEIAKGSIWSLSGNITFNLISFLYVILIARAVSQDDLGLFYLSLSIITLLFVIENLGMSSSLARYVPYFEGKGEKGKIKSLLKSSYAISVISATVLIAVIWLSADFIGEIYRNPELPGTLRLLSSLLLLNNLFKVNIEYLRGRANMKAMQFNMNLQNAMKLLLTVAFFYLYGATVFALSAAYIISVLVAVLASSFNVFRRTRDLPAEQVKVPYKQIFREIMPFGLMLSFMYFMGMFLLSADSAIIGYITEPSMATTMVAIYTVSLLLGGLVAIVPNSIGAIFLPVMSRIYGRDNVEDMRKLTETAQRWSLFVTVPVASILIAFSPEMLNAFYGPDYAGGAVVMSVFVAGVLIKSIALILALGLTAMRIVKLQLKIFFGIALAHVLIDIILISHFGIAGAAMTYIITSSAMVLAYKYYAKKFYGFVFSRQFYRIIAASVLIIIFVLAAKPFALAVTGIFPQAEEIGLELYVSKIIYLAYLGVLLAASFIIFMTLSLLLKCFGSEDIEIMGKIMRKIKAPESVIGLMGNIARRGVEG